NSVVGRVQVGLDPLADGIARGAAGDLRRRADRLFGPVEQAEDEAREERDEGEVRGEERLGEGGPESHSLPHRAPRIPEGAPVRTLPVGRRPAYSPRAAAGFSGGGASPVSIHADRSVNDTARTTGPMKIPTRPKAMSPPTTPANTSRNGRSAPLLMSMGRTMLSSGATTIVHTTRK